MAHITGNGSCRIRWQRQLRPISAFPAHRDSCVFPINIFEVESDDLTRSQTKPREQKQNGVIAASQRRAPVTMAQHLSHLTWQQMLGDSSERPTCHFRNGQRQIAVDQSFVVQVTQKRPRRCYQVFRFRWAVPVRMPLHKRGYINGTYLGQP
jgi:hypothetical protein